MPSSKQLRQLKSELGRLCLHFLPDKWNPTGTYNGRQLDLTRAYRILVHAEIEFYVESVLLGYVEKKYQQWKKNKRPNYVMICMMAASKTSWQDTETEALGLLPIDLSKAKIKKDDESVDHIIELVFEQYRNIVKDNNGIKSRDLKRLLMPVGIALSDLDQIWLGNMNSFGGQRGFVAHTSRIGVVNLPDPKTEKDTVDSLLVGLEELDEKIRKLP